MYIYIYIHVHICCGSFAENCVDLWRLSFPHIKLPKKYCGDLWRRQICAKLCRISKSRLVRFPSVHGMCYVCVLLISCVMCDAAYIAVIAAYLRTWDWSRHPIAYKADSTLPISRIKYNDNNVYVYIYIYIHI